jgi:NAD(P)H-dependent flavin oxidoreductase YrpB (nitropropane dioxygenase family)
MEKRGASLEGLREFIMGERAKKSWMEGEVDLGILACGQVMGLIREVVSVQELISSMVEGAVAIHQRLSPH